MNDQIDVVLDSLEGSEVHRDEPSGDEGVAVGNPRYLFRRDRLLVRDADLVRVDGVLGGDPATVQERVDRSTADTGRPGSINGLTRYLVQGGSMQDALDRVDAELGVGVATPDHVLYVTSSTGGCCPATEPLQPGRNSPDPGVNEDPATSGAGVLVSVVDTGLLTGLVDDGHQKWLKGVIGDVETSNKQLLRHYVGHGTFVAGIVRCMAPKADVQVDGFLPNGGAVYESEIVRQLGEALDRVPDIISLSAGAWTRNELPLMSFEVFYETRLRHLKGTVLVAAAGNDGNRGPFWPAAFPWTLSVGALDATSTVRAPYSNYGSWVDVYARGSDIVNAFPNGQYVYDEAPHKGESTQFTTGLAMWSGTSFATPLVSGLIAARMSRTGESAHDAAQVLKRMAIENARPGVGPILRPGMASA